MKISNMKKSTKWILIIGIAVAAVAAGIGIFFAASGTAGGVNGSSEPVFGEVTTGDISLSVSGSGNLASAKTLSIVADGYLVVEEVLVKEGDTLSAQQAIATLDVSAMETYADELKAQIAAQQISIDTTGNVTTQLSIKSPVDGWVKNVMLDDDDEISTAMEEYGYIALVATEKRQIIKVEDSSLKEGDEVKVRCEGSKHSGVVTNEDGELYVSIETIKRTVGAEAVVSDKDGNELFTGKIELAAYVPIESSYGIITDVKFKEDKAIEAGEAIYTASQYSLDVKTMYTTLNELKEELEVITAYINAEQITAPSAGVVSTVSITDAQTVEKGGALVSLESTDDWIATVAVDELDINSVQVGQNVDVELDSLPGEVFQGTVAAISDKGTASGGITTYSVDVSVEDNDRFKLNMTLNCEIMAQEVTGAVLAPIDALRTTGNTSYVLVKVERTDAEQSAITKLIDEKDYDGLAVYMGDDAAALSLTMLPDMTELLYAEVRGVETGIENAYYVEIKSGLSEGENVLLLESDSSTNFSGMFGMEMGGMMQQPGNQGGGQRPDGAGMPARN